MNFYENLSALRKAKGLSQEELAEKLGVSRQAISKWENGLTSPEMANVAKLCEVLGTTPNRLFGYDEQTEDKEPVPQKRQRPWWHYMLIVAGGIVVAHLAVWLVYLILFGTGFALQTYQPQDKAEAEIVKLEHPVVSKFDFAVSQTKEDSVTVKLDFVCAIVNDDYTYSVSVTEDEGKEKIYKAERRGGVYTAEIPFDIPAYPNAKVVALIEINGRTYSQYLAKVVEVTENSVAWD